MSYFDKLYLLLCLHLFIILVPLFKMLSSLWSAVANFSFRHNMHCFVAVLYDWCISRISHDKRTFLFCYFSFQISLERSLSVFYFLFLKDCRWFVYLTWTNLTDVVVNFISIILCLWCYICLALDVNTETLIV